MASTLVRLKHHQAVHHDHGPHQPGGFPQVQQGRHQRPDRPHHQHQRPGITKMHNFALFPPKMKVSFIGWLMFTTMEVMDTLKNHPFHHFMVVHLHGRACSGGELLCPQVKCVEMTRVEIVNCNVILRHYLFSRNSEEINFLLVIYLHFRPMATQTRGNLATEAIRERKRRQEEPCPCCQRKN